MKYTKDNVDNLFVTVTTQKEYDDLQTELIKRGIWQKKLFTSRMRYEKGYSKGNGKGTDISINDRSYCYSGFYGKNANVISFSEFMNDYKVTNYEIY